MVKQVVNERRRAERAKRILSIQYRFIKGRNKNPDIKWHLSTTQDMSVTGISFLSEVPYLIDDVLEIHVIMSGILDIYKGYGKVLRIEKKSTGVYYLIAVKFIANKVKKLSSKSVSKRKSKRIRDRVKK